MTDAVKITGLKELHAALQSLPAKIEQNVLRGALRAAAREIEAEAERIAPVASGALRDSIRVSVRAKRGEVTATIKAGDRKAWYAKLVEYGTARHYIKPKNRKSLFFAGLAREVVDHPGARRKPFMRPALDAKQQAAIDRMADYMRTRIPKELKKAGA